MERKERERQKIEQERRKEKEEEEALEQVTFIITLLQVFVTSIFTLQARRAMLSQPPMSSSAPVSAPQNSTASAPVQASPAPPSATPPWPCPLGERDTATQGQHGTPDVINMEIIEGFRIL